jgi:signal transduction histidine kinase
MNTADQRARYATVTAGARVFALIVLAPPVALHQEQTAIVSVILLGAVWMCAIFAEGLRRVPVMTALVLEASLITFISSNALVDSSVLLPALVIPPFIGGLVRGTRGAFEVLGAQLAICWATVFANDNIDLTENLAGTLFTWLMGGLGFGLIAAFVHRARLDDSTTVTSYRDARALITRLQELSGELVDGLDPVSIAQNILDLAREEVPLTGAVVYTRSAYGVFPLLQGDVSQSDIDNSALVDEVFKSAKTAIEGPWVAFPLMTDAGVVAVVAGGLTPANRPSSAAIRASLDALATTLRAEALQLDTALLFSAVRDEATAEERRRLARDLHDGVAQDIASLGYMIDDLTESAETAEQADRCRELRTELTKVVTELRRSVFVLRNETQGGSSLGESIRALASHIETRSGISVVVDLDEGSERLRPDVESELLRIAQEGMNNAVKHARASRMFVACTVHAPYASIKVSDNGRGLQSGRDDSHGVRIMRERARRIGADLDLRNAEGRSGTELTVVLDAASRSEGPGSTMEGMLS